VLDFYVPRHPIPEDIPPDFEPNPVITTEIIEEGKIAKLAVNCFMTYAEPQIINFLQDIHGYEHLIIDLRSNRGGMLWYFAESIMRPIMSEPFLLESFAFLNPRGDYTVGTMRYILGQRYMWQGLGITQTFSEQRTVSEILGEFDLPEFNMADAQRLVDGFYIQLELTPSHSAHFDHQPAFEGKIWLLTGPGMYSAAQHAAWAAKESGFATLVGEVTGGCYGGLRTLVALPHSGILFQMDTYYITDHHGRPLEAGTIPHHFNHEGMDALATTLALIEEGMY